MDIIRSFGLICKVRLYDRLYSFNFIIEVKIIVEVKQTEPPAGGVGLLTRDG